MTEVTEALHAGMNSKSGLTNVSEDGLEEDIVRVQVDKFDLVLVQEVIEELGWWKSKPAPQELHEEHQHTLGRMVSGVSSSQGCNICLRIKISPLLQLVQLGLADGRLLPAGTAAQH